MQQLVVSYDQAQAHQAAVEAQLATVTVHLAADRKAEFGPMACCGNSLSPTT